MDFTKFLNIFQLSINLTWLFNLTAIIFYLTIWEVNTKQVMLAKVSCFSSTTSQHQLCHMASYFQPDIICKSFKSPSSLNFINEYENSVSPLIVTFQVFPNNSACRQTVNITHQLYALPSSVCFDSIKHQCYSLQSFPFLPNCLLPSCLHFWWVYPICLHLKHSFFLKGSWHSIHVSLVVYEKRLRLIPRQPMHTLNVLGKFYC